MRTLLGAITLLVITQSIVAHELPDGLVKNSDLDAISDFEQAIIKDKCSSGEEINRYHLQQNWFFNESKTDHGMIFGQTGFADYSISPNLHAAYCIEKDMLIASYYHFSPSYSINGERISEGELFKYRSIPAIRIQIKTLTQNRMVLFFVESKEELILYR